MNEIAGPTWRPDSFIVGGFEGKLTLREFGHDGYVFIRQIDQDLMQRWKSGAALSRAEDALVAWYIGMLVNQQHNLEAARETKMSDKVSEDADVKQEGPMDPPALRVTTDDTARYIKMRDMLADVISNNADLLTDASRELAEALLNEFTIEVPNNY